MLSLIQLFSDFRESCLVWYLVCRSPNTEGRQMVYASLRTSSAGQLVMAGEKMDQIENEVRAEMGLGKLG